MSGGSGQRSTIAMPLAVRFSTFTEKFLPIGTFFCNGVRIIVSGGASVPFLNCSGKKYLSPNEVARYTIANVTTNWRNFWERGGVAGDMGWGLVVTDY